METIFRQELRQNKYDSFSEETAYSEDFPLLWQFPTEFKRNWFKQLDPRFFIILLSTFILEVGTLLLLLSWVKGKDQNVDVNTIQKQYAHLLLDKSLEKDFLTSETAAKEKDTYLYDVPEEIEQASSNSESQERSGLSSSNRSVNNYVKDVRLKNNNDSENYSGQGTLDKTSSNQTKGSSEWIASQGLLQYISDDRSKAKDGDLQEIFTQGDNNARYLEGSLANVKLTSFRQQGESTESGGEGAISFSGLKGSKSNVSTDEIRSSLTPLEKAQYRTMAKNTELEDFSASTLNKTGSKTAARKAEHVTKVILSHNRAIQDCFKQALKKYPGLKGKVVIRFSVTPDGWVDRVEILNSTIEYESMLNCIINRMRRWNDFGESDSSLGTVSYRQTYVFGY